MTPLGLSARVSVLLVVGAACANAQAYDASHRASMERLGAVDFPTSCKPAVTPQFNRAMALLHSFEFGASIRAFTDVLYADPTCAMAQWGIALSRWSNPTAPSLRTPAQLQPGLEAAQAAQRLGDQATERERGYIAAVAQLYADFERRDQRTRIVAYELAMANLVAAQPADTEAKIFYALSLVASAAPTDKRYVNQLKAGAILESIWAQQPDHPGLAHYIIHAYDYPALADRAEAAAQRYSQIAPSAAHAMHMPSHTFTRVGLWKESVATNLRSLGLALESGSIAEALHASDYAVYAYLQMQRDSAAKQIVLGLPALKARFDVNAVTGAAPGWAGVFALASIPARYALERRDWSDAAKLVPVPSAFPYTEAMVYFARALGASHVGDLATAEADADTLAAISRRLAARGESYWSEQVAIQALSAQAWLAHARQQDSVALARMQEAATREDATEKSAVTPGPLVPARELLGDLLMELTQPAAALKAYRTTLEKEPNRFRAVEGASRAAAASGDHAAASAYATQLRRITGA